MRASLLFALFPLRVLEVVVYSGNSFKINRSPAPIYNPLHLGSPPPTTSPPTPKPYPCYTPPMRLIRFLCLLIILGIIAAILANIFHGNTLPGIHH